MRLGLCLICHLDGTKGARYLLAIKTSEISLNVLRILYLRISDTVIHKILSEAWQYITLRRFVRAEHDTFHRICLIRQDKFWVKNLRETYYRTSERKKVIFCLTVCNGCLEKLLLYRTEYVLPRSKFLSTFSLFWMWITFALKEEKKLMGNEQTLTELFKYTFLL